MAAMLPEGIVNSQYDTYDLQDTTVCKTRVLIPTLLLNVLFIINVLWDGCSRPAIWVI